EQHTRPMQTQGEVRNNAMGNRDQSFRANHGRPAEAVSTRPVAATPGIVAPPVRGGFGGNRPGEPTRPGQIVQPSQPNNGRPGEFNRPGQPNQPQPNNGRPGEFNRPGQPNQPQPNNGRPGEFNRPGQPNQQPN